MTRDGRDRPEDRELGDERLGAALRSTLKSDRAPEEWVQDALEIPRRAGAARRSPWPAGRVRSPIPGALSGRVPSREPWMVTLFPHLAGFLLLGGLVAVWITSPVRAALEPAVRALGHLSGAPAPGFWTLAGFLVPLFVLAIDQAVRGFPILRRLHLTH